MLRNCVAALLVALSFTPLAVVAENGNDTCQRTYSMTPHRYPGKAHILPSSNLAKPASKLLPAEGVALTIHGLVLDSQCVPVPGAQLELWHTDSNAKYHYPNNKELAASQPVFAGAGRTYTDNHGRFAFFTIFPGAITDQAPYVNIRVQMPERKKPFETRLFFENDLRNESDRRYQALSDTKKQSVTMKVTPSAEGISSAHAKIILPAKNRYIRY
jgi:protocatechuate 3,4-dioxygenase beta subunit